jgi:hypothetical protein
LRKWMAPRVVLEAKSPATIADGWWAASDMTLHAYK